MTVTDGQELLAERWVPISHLQGDAKLIRVDFTRIVDGEEVGRDMSAYSFSAQIRSRPGASAVMASLEVDDSAAGDGIVVAELLAPQSSGLHVGRWHWDFQRQLGADRPLTFALGSWTVVGQVTR